MRRASRAAAPAPKLGTGWDADARLALPAATGTAPGRAGQVISPIRHLTRPLDWWQSFGSRPSAQKSSTDDRPAATNTAGHRTVRRGDPERRHRGVIGTSFVARRPTPTPGRRKARSPPFGAGCSAAADRPIQEVRCVTRRSPPWRSDRAGSEARGRGERHRLRGCRACICRGRDSRSRCKR